MKGLGLKITVILLAISLVCLGLYSWYRIDTLTSTSRSWQEQASSLVTEINSLKEQIHKLQYPTPPPWSPDSHKLLLVPQLRQGPYTITVPPADYRIIPISVGEYEHLIGWSWWARGENEDYLDSWLVNSSGTKISESGRTFNFGTIYAFGDDPGLGPGTYYIYLSNEFTSACAKSIELTVKWQ